MCTSCCTAIPHDSRVNAMGKIPLVKVGEIPMMSTSFAYNASTTGRMVSAMTVLYFERLDWPYSFSICFISIQNGR